MKKVLSKIDSFFKITEKGSTIGRELIAGVIVFLAMVYIPGPELYFMNYNEF